jgi:CRP-like cAMP-binding protein
MSSLDRSLLHAAPAFASLTDEEMDAVLAYARSVRYPKDNAVFEQGGQADSFFVLLDGNLQVVKVTPAGQQVVIRYVVPGELFGIAVQMGRPHYPATATAVVDSVALVWPSSSWPSILARCPALADSALRIVGARLDDAHVRVVEMSTEEVERRIAHALLRLVKQAGRKVEDGIQISFPITREDVAQMTGTTLHTVSRILSGWEARGLVEGGRQRIVVRDPHGLFAIAETPKA